MRIDAERLVHGACTVLALLLSMAIIAMIPAIRSAGTLDTGGWFLLASGRKVVESGIPTTNPFTAVEGQGIVLQQWLHGAWLYLCWKAAGYTGVAVSVAIPPRWHCVPIPAPSAGWRESRAIHGCRC